MYFLQTPISVPVADFSNLAVMTHDKLIPMQIYVFLQTGSMSKWIQKTKLMDETDSSQNVNLYHRMQGL